MLPMYNLCRDEPLEPSQLPAGQAPVWLQCGEKVPQVPRLQFMLDKVEQLQHCRGVTVLHRGTDTGNTCEHSTGVRE